MNEGKPNLRNSSRLEVQKVVEVWSKTKIPRVQEIRGSEKVEAAYKEWPGIKRHKNYRNLTKDGKARLKKFEEDLDKLFDLAKKSGIIRGTISRDLTSRAHPRPKGLAWPTGGVFFPPVAQI